MRHKSEAAPLLPFKGGIMGNNFAGFEWGLFAVIFLIMIGVALGILTLVAKAMAGVPDKYRPMNPGQVFLLIVPLFNLYWNFRVFEPMMQGYTDALTAKKLPVNGDGGVGMAKWYSIVNILCMVPLLNLLAAPAVLILFIMILVRAFDAKKALA
jgi:hypothetical protein